MGFPWGIMFLLCLVMLTPSILALMWAGQHDDCVLEVRPAYESCIAANGQYCKEKLDIDHNRCMEKHND